MNPSLSEIPGGIFWACFCGIRVLSAPWAVCVCLAWPDSPSAKTHNLHCKNQKFAVQILGEICTAKKQNLHCRFFQKKQESALQKQNHALQIFQKRDWKSAVKGGFGLADGGLGQNLHCKFIFCRTHSLLQHCKSALQICAANLQICAASLRCKYALQICTANLRCKSALQICSCAKRAQSPDKSSRQANPIASERKETINCNLKKRKILQCSICQ